jgi:hypothetical protein
MADETADRSSAHLLSVTDQASPRGDVGWFRAPSTSPGSTCCAREIHLYRIQGRSCAPIPTQPRNRSTRSAPPNRVLERTGSREPSKRPSRRRSDTRALVEALCEADQIKARQKTVFRQSFCLQHSGPRVDWRRADPPVARAVPDSSRRQPVRRRGTFCPDASSTVLGLSGRCR